MRASLVNELLCIDGTRACVCVCVCVCVCLSKRGGEAASIASASAYLLDHKFVSCLRYCCVFIAVSLLRFFAVSLLRFFAVSLLRLFAVSLVPSYRHP